MPSVKSSYGQLRQKEVPCSCEPSPDHLEDGQCIAIYIYIVWYNFSYCKTCFLFWGYPREVKYIHNYTGYTHKFLAISKRIMFGERKPCGRMDLEDTIVMVVLIFGGNSSIHSSSLISFNILLFAVSEGKCLVQVIQQDLSSSASATSGAEMEQVVKL